MSVLTKALILKLEIFYSKYKTYCLCESLAVLFLMSLQKFLVKQKSRLLIETEQIKGGSKAAESSALLASSYLQQLAFSGV